MFDYFADMMTHVNQRRALKKCLLCQQQMSQSCKLSVQLENQGKTATSWLMHKVRMATGLTSLALTDAMPIVVNPMPGHLQNLLQEQDVAGCGRLFSDIKQPQSGSDKADHTARTHFPKARSSRTAYGNVASTGKVIPDCMSEQGNGALPSTRAAWP